MSEHTAVRSTASIAGHPIHPMLVPLPIGLLSAAFASDLAYVWSGDRFWARASRWLTAGGVLTGASAALFGITDFVTLRRPREHVEGWLHGAGNALVLALGLASLRLRLADGDRAVVPWGVMLSGLSAMILTVTGWLGGELSYRYKVGVIDDRDA
ncbi:MAG: DUF2231 domain-containing protein [Chloroflexota bacterium]|nr:DUF2231 domain-containing protein [Chloroflexota bacterium]